MTTLRDEMMASYYLYESGASLEIARDERGGVRLQRVPDPAAEAAALGPGAYRDPYAISEAAGAPVSEQEVAGTMGGVVPGAAIGAATGIQDIGALAYGGIKAATAEEGQRIDEFLKGFQAISGVIGSEKAFELYNAGVDALPISDEAKQGLRQGAMVGEVIGFGGAAGEAGKGVAKGVQTYAAGAPQRIADRTSGTTLGMGADPTAMVDEAIVAGQKLLKEGKGPTAESPVAVVPPTETEPGIIAFHGSGADFDQFTLEKIGTGEGAQAYGYGLYFTDSEDIAKFYRDAVGGANVLKRAENIKIANPDGGQETAANFSGFRNKFAKYYGDNAALFADRYLGQFTIEPDASEDVLIQRAIDTINAVKESDKIPDNPKEIISKITLPDRGKIYKVGLEPKPEDMLDYEKSISEQSQKVQDALYANEGIASIIKRKQKEDRLPPEFYTGEELYADLAENLQSAQAASNELADAGILGLKYTAAGSRGANIDAADVEKNYVIFDDKAIRILEKYGIVGPVAVTAIAGAQQQEGDDNGA